MTLVNLDPNLNPSRQLAALRKKINDILDKGIAQFLIPYSNSKEPLYIYIQGYTPSFNDGEPCIHKSYVYSADEIIENEILEYDEDLFGDITKEQLENSRPYPTDKDGFILSDFFQALEAVEEALEFQYSTDYQVLITLQNGNVTYVRDHFECGF